MAVTLKSSPLRISVLFFLIFLNLIRLADLTISTTLSRYKPVIQGLLQKTTGFEIYFESLDFTISRGLRFNNFTIQKGGQKIAFIKELRFSLSPLALLKRQVGINAVILNEGWTTTGIAKYKDYMISSMKNLTMPERAIPAGGQLSLTFHNPKIAIEKLKIYLDSQSGNRGWIGVNSQINLRRENLLCKASIDFKDTNFNHSPQREMLFYKFSHKFNIYLQLAFMEEDLLVNNIILSSDNLKINGAGIIYHFKSAPLMDLKFISVPLNLKEVVNLKSKMIINGLLNIAANLRGDAGGVLLQTEMMMAKSEFYLPKKLVRLSDVFCNFQFRNNEIAIKELSCLVNYRFPVYLSGRIFNWKKPELNLRIESFKTRQSEYSFQETTNFILNITSKLENYDIGGDIDLTLLFKNDLPHYTSKKEVKAALKNLRFALTGDPLQQSSGRYGFKLTGEELSILNQEMVNENLEHSVELKLSNLSSRLLFDQDGVLNTEMQSGAYGGKVEARGRWDLINANPLNFFLIRFIDLSVADLKDIFPSTAEIAGKLNGILYLNQQKQLFWGGAIAISEAEIKNLTLIDNVADFLGLKSIKELNNVFLLSDFTFDRYGIRVKRFNLHNPILDLESDLFINDQEWVMGKVHLSLPKEVLEESDILRKLISMVGEKNQVIDFDFRISGFTKGLRLELLEGEFRNRLISGLSSGIRSQIESEIDKAIDYFHQKGAP